MKRTAKPSSRPRFVPVFFGNLFAVAGADGHLLRNYGRVRTWDTLEEAYRAAAEMLGVSFERFLDLMEPHVGRLSFDPRLQGTGEAAA